MIVYIFRRRGWVIGRTGSGRYTEEYRVQGPADPVTVAVDLARAVTGRGLTPRKVTRKYVWLVEPAGSTS